MQDPLYSLVAELEGLGAKHANFGRECSYAARRIMEAQGQPAKQQEEIDAMISKLVAFGESLPNAKETVK